MMLGSEDKSVFLKKFPGSLKILYNILTFIFFNNVFQFHQNFRKKIFLIFFVANLFQKVEITENIVIFQDFLQDSIKILLNIFKNLVECFLKNHLKSCKIPQKISILQDSLKIMRKIKTWIFFSK